MHNLLPSACAMHSTQPAAQTHQKLHLQVLQLAGRELLLQFLQLPLLRTAPVSSSAAGVLPTPLAQQNCLMMIRAMRFYTAGAQVWPSQQEVK
jgi:hypothetical protein